MLLSTSTETEGIIKCLHVRTLPDQTENTLCREGKNATCVTFTTHYRSGAWLTQLRAFSNISTINMEKDQTSDYL